MAKRAYDPDFAPIVLKELGQIKVRMGKHGPEIVKAQVVKYGEDSKPLLNIQTFWEDADGNMNFGKRKALDLIVVAWLQKEKIMSCWLLPAVMND